MSGLSSPRILYGVHSITPYNRTTKAPYGILKVIGSASLSLTAAVDQLYGGSSKFAWAAESKTISSDFSAKVKAYPGFLFTLWLGGTVVDNAAEASASVTTLTNVNGSTAKSATIGVASVAVHTGSEATVKFGSFMVKAVSATTVDIYAISDVDFARGTAASFQNDLLKITATPLTVVTSGALTNIPGTGIDLVGGSGTIGMTTGDTAFFQSRPINTISSDITIGASSTSMPNFGVFLLAQKRATAEMFEIEAYNCIASGFPLPMDEMAFSNTELKLTLLYDSAQDAVFKIRTVTPTSFN